MVNFLFFYEVIKTHNLLCVFITNQKRKEKNHTQSENHTIRQTNIRHKQKQSQAQHTNRQDHKDNNEINKERTIYIKVGR